MNPDRHRAARSAREVTALEVEPLMLSWQDGDVVRATLRRVSELPVIAVGGALDATAVEACRRALEAALRCRPHNVIIDLAAVTSSGPECVALLGAMRRRAAWHGAQVWLAAVPEHVRAALDRSGSLDLYAIERNSARVVDIIRLRQTPSRGVPVPAHLAQRNSAAPSNSAPSSAAAPSRAAASRTAPADRRLPTQPRTA